MLTLLLLHSPDSSLQTPNLPTSQLGTGVYWHAQVAYTKTQAKRSTSYTQQIRCLSIGP